MHEWLNALMPSVVKNEKCQLTQVQRCRSRRQVSSSPDPLATGWARLPFPKSISARGLSLFFVLGLTHNTACLLALAVMRTTAAGLKLSGAYVQI